MHKHGVLIPTHNHHRALPAIIDRLRSVGLPIFIVDDGSSPETQEALQDLTTDDVHVLRLPTNRGKGGAVLAGLRWMKGLGFNHAFQIDADGQHCLDTLETFLDVSRMNPQALISGQPLYDESIPKIREFGRWFTHVWVWIETLSLRITDSLCGFRIYPVQKSLEIMETKRIGHHMEFDTDIMVHLFWSGTPVIMLPLKVTYPEGNSSNFKMLKDNWRITKMHTRLFFTMLMNLQTILSNRPDYSSLKLPQEGICWASLEERGSLMGLLFLAGCYRLLGKRFCMAIGTPVVLFHYLRGTAQRESSRIYLERVLHKISPGRKPGFKDYFRHYMNFFEMALDKVAAWIGEMKVDQITFQGESNFENIMSQSKGGMILVSHLGNMEFCRAAACGNHKSRLHVLLHSKNSQRFNRLLKAFNPLSTVNIIEVTEIGPDTILYLKERISQGDWIIVAADRVPVKGVNRVSIVPFLGKDAPFSQGPYILAALLECPVYTAIAVREGKKIKVFIDSFAEKILLNRASRMADIREYTEKFTIHLEKYTLLYPYQWFNFFDFWNENDYMNDETKMKEKPMTQPTIDLGMGHRLSIEELDLISQRKLTLRLSPNEGFREHINAGAEYLSEMLRKEGYIYGVTTGYGDNCSRPVPLDLVDELPLHLTRFHGCGLGALLSVPQTRRVLAVRLASLCQGVSGVTVDLLERLEMLLDHDILPVIPSEGSVGASGDLTPLSYIAAVIIDERDVWYEGERRPTADVYRELNITPYKLQPKEALALMNGTSVMTALATEAYTRAEYLMRLSARMTAMTSLALRGNPQHFNERLFAAKPHEGQGKIATYIRNDLVNAPATFPVDRLQDRYSTRCAPHVIGVLEDMLPTFKKIIETEINSANDNPLIFVPEEGESFENENIVHGGHFYGGHICFVMDSLKNLVANLADLMDRQLATLVDPKFNHGLPANLSGVEGHRAAINHGLKAIQIGASAWTAEALKNTMPASVFSRSTESHNQDKVSMGTIAARDALRVLELTEQVASAHLIATLQALRLREREGSRGDGHFGREHYSDDMRQFMDQLADYIPFIEEDQPLEGILRELIAKIQGRAWNLYGIH